MELRNLLMDRDGTLIEDAHYLCDPAGVRLIAGAGQALARLTEAGVRLLVVSNQSAIGRGYCTTAQVEATNARVSQLLLAQGARITATAYCPHGPEAGCACRKPAIGLWLQLRDAYGLAPETTAMAGDKLDDIRFARNAGLACAILVRTGKGPDTAAALGLADPGREWLEPAAPGGDIPDCHAADLAAACRWLARRPGSG